MCPSTGPADHGDAGESAAWPAAWRAALSEPSLVALCSKTIFDWGAHYAASDAVEVDEEDPMPEPALRARLRGSETYDVEVWIEADAVAGACSCPHAADGWFCKHQVALAIVWQQRLWGGSTAAAAPSQSSSIGRRAPKTAPSRSAPDPLAPDVSLRASILCSESRWLDAWAVVQPPSVCTDAVSQQIARHLPATHHAEAVRVLKRVFERVMLSSTSPYQEALPLVADIVERLPAAERSAWWQQLRTEFKAKRNIMRDLPSG